MRKAPTSVRACRIGTRAHQSIAAHSSWSSVGPPNTPRRVIHAGLTVMAVTVSLGPARKSTRKLIFLTHDLERQESLPLSNRCIASRTPLVERELSAFADDEKFLSGVVNEFRQSLGFPPQSDPASTVFECLRPSAAGSCRYSRHAPLLHASWCELLPPADAQVPIAPCSARVARPGVCALWLSRILEAASRVHPFSIGR